MIVKPSKEQSQKIDEYWQKVRKGLQKPEVHDYSKSELDVTHLIRNKKHDIKYLFKKIAQLEKEILELHDHQYKLYEEQNK